MSEKVYVGLSGGVDSAVSAALLKSEGFDVVGVFIKIWQPTFLECTWEKDRLDAMRVAVTLDIPFREVDLSNAYEKNVVKEMIAVYEKGSTPNPDVLCNEKIKFGVFTEWALAEGAQKIATGHYARVEHKDGEYRLLRGTDGMKDQSYFLYRMGNSNLARSLFPVGGLTKAHVRQLASDFSLSVANKHDSQGLCFVGDVSMRDFLSRYMQVTPGNVIDSSGAVIGAHDGAPLYTIGQRHGLRISSTSDTSQSQYVIAIDAKSNTLTVSTRVYDAAKKQMRVTDVMWLQEPTPDNKIEVQTRYREKTVQCSLRKAGDAFEVIFEQPHVISSGQSAVFYSGDRCYGGGVIV